MNGHVPSRRRRAMHIIGRCSSRRMPPWRPSTSSLSVCSARPTYTAIAWRGAGSVDPLEVANLITLIAFVVGLVVGTISTVLRMVSYRLRRIPLPKLIWRDLAYVGLLALVFVMVIVGRLLPELALWRQLWWVILTGLLANAGVWTYAYFELRIIDR